MLNAHIKDAVALCDWAARMEYEIQVPKKKIKLKKRNEIISKIGLKMPV